MVVIDVNLRAGFDGDEAGAKTAGFGEAGVAFEAEFFGFEAEGDHAGGFGEQRDDGDGLATEFRSLLLFDGGEVRIKIDGERAEHGWKRRRGKSAVKWRVAGSVFFAMRIAVISDTHDKYPEDLPARLQDADEIWHLGDVCEPETLVEFKQLGKPLHIVLGNNEWEALWPLELTLEREGVRFFLQHIAPKHPPAGVDVVLHGHTHVPRDEVAHGVRWLNPGCITRPNRGAPASFAWLTVKKGQPLKWELELL